MELLVITAQAQNRALVFNESSHSNGPLAFRNNRFVDGSMGIYCREQWNNRESGLLIESNVFRNQYYVGVSLTYQNDFQVFGNRISTNTSYTSYRGMYLNDERGFSLFNNSVSANSPGSPSSMEVHYSRAFQGMGNSIYNNFFHVEGTAANYPHGVLLNSCRQMDFVFNSIHQTSTSINARALDANICDSLRIENNIVVNEGNGIAVDYAWNGSTFSSDHNNLYSANGDLGDFQGTIHPELSDWLSTGNDINSVSAPPVFYSDSNLHTSSSALDMGGIPIAGITADIDGDPRDPTNPGIGADEFEAKANDIGILALDGPIAPFATGNQNILLHLVNNGTVPLTSAVINWSINGTNQIPLVWNGSIPAGQSEDSILVGSLQFEVDSVYNLVFWSSLPNGVTDSVPQNDTLHVYNLVGALVGGRVYHWWSRSRL